jgi:alpha-ketoglutarate-dependent taurine dioxygenase
MGAGSDFYVEPLDATFGAVVRGLRLAEVGEEAFERLYAAWLEHALLIFPEQHLTDDEQLAFAHRFGELEFPLAPISNQRPDGSLRDENDLDDDVVKILKGNLGWHADSTYVPVQAKAAVFSARVVPSRGGETEWADMRAAYDALDPAMRERAEKLAAHHSIAWSQARLGYAPPPEGSEYGQYGFDVGSAPLRPLVKVHPETGRRSLLIGRHAHAIPGLSPEESERLLDELVEWACQPPRVVRHAWSVGDAVIWDNRCLLHRGRPWDLREPRTMVHARIAGDPATESAIAA